MAVSTSGIMPNWLETLFGKMFFLPCSIHEDDKKNVFCLDCCSGVCPLCIQPHRLHRLLQIRRYVYHDVVQLADLEKLIDCAAIQPYTTNNAKVVFLKERANIRNFRGGGGGAQRICSSCDRPLQRSYLHCSLYCKVRHILNQEEGEIWKHLRKCDFLPLVSSCDLEEDPLSPECILDFPSGGAGGDTTGRSAVREKSLVGMKQNSSRSPSPARKHRRKGVPRRAPFF